MSDGAVRRTAGSRKLRLLGAFLGRRPVWCSWQVTRRCDGLCQFCEHRLEGGAPDPDLAACLRVVEALGSGTLVVSLTGGDPLLRADLPEIVAALARRHFPLVTTHGWLLGRERARELWRAGLAGASVILHHAEARRHDEAAGLPGAYARALEALEALASERTQAAQQVNVKTRLDPADLDGLEALLRLASRAGASVTLDPAFPLPAAAPPPADLGERLLALKRRHVNLRSSAGFLGLFPRALREGVPGCQAGRAFLNVDPRGRVSKCIEFTGAEDVLGELDPQALDALLPRLREAHAANTCRACFYSSRGEVEGLYTLRGLVGALPALLRA